MKIKHPKCQIFIYNEQKPVDVFDLKDFVATAVENSDHKKNIEFVRITGLDETGKQISVRLDFGSITTDANKAPAGQDNENRRIDNLFGEILIQMGYITKIQLDECLDLQTKSDNTKKLGEILIEKNYIKPNELVSAITQQVGETYLKKQLKKIK